MTKADVIEKWLYSKVGCGYVYGATGWVCSMKRREQQASQYPEYEKTILTTCAKWDGKECYDCAQLVAQAGKQVGIKLPSGATSQWKSQTVWAAQGIMADIPFGQLLCLFRHDDGKMQHVGWLLRDGSVIDARGSDSGVVLNKPYSKWTHWGILKGLEDEWKEEEKVQAKVIADTGKTVNLRRSPTTIGSIEAYVPVGDLVDVVSMNGDWWEVMWNGRGGHMMSKFLRLTTETETHQPTVEERLTSVEKRLDVLETSSGKVES